MFRCRLSAPPRHFSGVFLHVQTFEMRERSNREYRTLAAPSRAPHHIRRYIQYRTHKKQNCAERKGATIICVGLCVPSAQIRCQSGAALGHRGACHWHLSQEPPVASSRGLLPRHYAGWVDSPLRTLDATWHMALQHCLLAFSVDFGSTNGKKIVLLTVRRDFVHAAKSGAQAVRRSAPHVGDARGRSRAAGQVIREPNSSFSEPPRRGSLPALATCCTTFASVERMPG